MKKISHILLAVLLTAVTNAQAPEKMSYQAVIRNNSNTLVPNTQIGIEINIRQGSPTGTIVYNETQTPTTNPNGLVIVEIGGGAGFSTIDWSNGPYFIETNTAVVPPLTTYTITGTNQLLSVPYALHAKTSETVTGTITETQNLADVIAINNSANAQIKNLTAPTDDQDAATKAYVDELENKVNLLENALIDAIIHPSKFKDNRDGSIYEYVTIGNQVWMAENLKYLPGVVGPATGSSTTEYYYVYGYNGTVVADAKATTNYSTYGVLYNWTAAMNGAVSSTANPSGVQGVCPTGWHLPSDAEWTELTDHLGGLSVAGGKLKETGTVHWISPNTGANNETGFTAIPGGLRDNGSSSFAIIGYGGYWWNATESSATNSHSRSVGYENSSVSNSIYPKSNGFSVRCVRD